MLPPIGPYMDGPFRGPLPPQPIQGPFPGPIPPPIPHQEPFSQPAIFPGSFGLMSYIGPDHAYNGGFQPDIRQDDGVFKRKYITLNKKNPSVGVAINTRKYHQLPGRTSQTLKEKEKESENLPINLTVHIHNSKPIKTKITKEKIGEIKGKVKGTQSSERSLSKKPKSPDHKKEHLEKAREVSTERKGKALFLNVGRERLPAVPKSIPALKKYSHGSGLSNLPGSKSDMLSTRQSMSPIHLQIPTPKYFRQSRLGHLSQNQEVSRYPKQEEVYRNRITGPIRTPHKSLNKYEFETIRDKNRPISAHPGQYPNKNINNGPLVSNNKVKPGLIGVPDAYDNKAKVVQQKGLDKGKGVPANLQHTNLLNKIDRHHKKMSKPSKQKKTVVDKSIVNKASDHKTNINDPYNNAPVTNKLKPIPTLPDIPKVPKSTGLTHAISIEKSGGIHPEASTKHAGPDLLNGGLSKQDTYNQLLISLMLMMFQQQQMANLQEKMKGMTGPPYAMPNDHKSSTYNDIAPTKAMQGHKSSLGVDKNHLTAPYAEKQKVLPTNSYPNQVQSKNDNLHQGNTLESYSPSAHAQQSVIPGQDITNLLNHDPPKPAVIQPHSQHVYDNTHQANNIISKPDYPNIANNNAPSLGITPTPSAYEYTNNANAISSNLPNNANVLYLRTNPQDKSVYISSSNDPIGKGKTSDPLHSKSSPLSDNTASHYVGKPTNTTSEHLHQYEGGQDTVYQTGGFIAQTGGPSIQTGGLGQQTGAIGSQMDGLGLYTTGLGQQTDVQSTGPQTDMPGPQTGGLNSLPNYSGEGQHVVEIPVSPVAVPHKASLKIQSAGGYASDSQPITSHKSPDAYNPSGPILDVSGLQGQNVPTVGNPPSKVLVPQSGTVGRTHHNDLNSKLDRLIALFENQTINNNNLPNNIINNPPNNLNKVGHMKQPPAYLKQTNPELYADIMESNAEQAGLAQELQRFATGV